uniref:Quinol oxidase subunit 4 n=1 Tax=Chryseobacterium endophyticum TaxID=1854762 RepID=A0AAU6WNB7_9FLAO
MKIYLLPLAAVFLFSCKEKNKSGRSGQGDTAVTQTDTLKLPPPDEKSSKKNSAM